MKSLYMKTEVKTTCSKAEGDSHAVLITVNLKRMLVIVLVVSDLLADFSDATRS